MTFEAKKLKDVHKSQSCCVVEYDLLLELRHRIVDLSNLVGEQERNAEQIEKRSTMVIQALKSQKPHKQKVSNAKHVKKIYPSTEMLDKIEEINVIDVLRKDKMCHHMRQQQQSHQLSQFPSSKSPPLLYTSENNVHSRRVQTEDAQFTPSHSTDYPSFALKSIPEHLSSHAETHHSENAKSIQTTSSPSYEDARARVAAASRCYDDERDAQVTRRPYLEQRPSVPERWESFQEKLHPDYAMSNPSQYGETDLQRSVPYGRRTEVDDARFFSRNSNVNHTGSTQEHQRQPPTKSSSSSMMMQLEISPGVYAQLRGAGETLHAVQDGNIVHCECICCTMQLVCIADAEFVLCPECRVVNPLLEQHNHHHYNYKPDARGVGLGMSLDDYQAQLQRNRYHPNSIRPLTTLAGGGRQHAILASGDRGWAAEEYYSRTYGHHY